MKYIKKKKKLLLILGFSFVFTSAYYISLVGAKVILSNPETTIKTSIINTMTKKPVEFAIKGSLSSIGLIPQSTQKFASRILDDMILESTLTYIHKLKAIDFRVMLSSSSYDEAIIEAEGYSTKDKVFIKESQLLKESYFFPIESFLNEKSIEELVNQLLINATSMGIMEYTTIAGDTSYANVYEIKDELANQEVFMEIYINNKLEIVQIHLIIKDNSHTLVDVNINIHEVERELNHFDVSDAKQIEIPIYE